MKEGYVNIGKRLPRIDGIVKATGEAKFAGDLSPVGMLHAKILRSPYPHARLLHIHTDKAKRLSGVRAVVTGKETVGFKAGGISATGDEPYLALDKVRFIGDAMAAVAAIDEETAEEALDLIEVEYEELPAVVDPVAAMKQEAPLIHDHAPLNISFKTDLSYGDNAYTSPSLTDKLLDAVRTRQVPAITTSSVSVPVALTLIRVCGPCNWSKVRVSGSSGSLNVGESKGKSLSRSWPNCQNT